MSEGKRCARTVLLGEQHQMRCVFRCSPMLYCAFVLHISFSTSSLRSRWHSPSHCLPAYRRAPIKSFQLLLVVAMRMYAYISNRLNARVIAAEKEASPPRASMYIGIHCACKIHRHRCCFFACAGGVRGGIGKGVDACVTLPRKFSCGSTGDEQYVISYRSVGYRRT